AGDVPAASSEAGDGSAAARWVQRRQARPAARATAGVRARRDMTGVLPRVDGIGERGATPRGGGDIPRRLSRATSIAGKGQLKSVELGCGGRGAAGVPYPTPLFPPFVHGQGGGSGARSGRLQTVLQPADRRIDGRARVPAVPGVPAVPRAPAVPCAPGAP